MNKKQTEILNDYILHSALHMLSVEEQCLKKVCAKDLSVKELHVIEAVSCLSGDEKNTMAEIARYLHLSPASLTTSANVLVKKGYIEREYSQVDRRVIFISLTEKGKIANRKYLDFIKDMLCYLGKELDEQSADGVISAILRMEEYLEQNSSLDSPLPE